MTTDASERRRAAGGAARRLQRNRRPGRWLHAATYLATLVLAGTGWWLLLGREGEPSVLARVLGIADTDTHKIVGWALLALGVAVPLLRFRAVLRFLAASLRFQASDGRWLLRWPPATVSGRFASHRGHFDPGQRVANVLMLGSLLVLVVSGVGLVLVHGGPVFVWLVRVHRWTTYVLTPIIIGHMIVASGVLPGYRGVWRAMHARGDVPEATARRIWPAWAEQQLRERTGRPDR